MKLNKHNLTNKNNQSIYKKNHAQLISKMIVFQKIKIKVFNNNKIN